MAGSLGYCGLDRRRQPLAGDEIRPCWEAWPGGTDQVHAAPPAIKPADDAAAATTRAVRLEFVEVGDRPVADSEDARTEPSGAGPAPSRFGPAPLLPAPDNEPGWSLWGDPDR